MLKINREKSVLVMSDKNAPAAYAKDGDTVIFETYDCFTNKLRSPSDLFSTVSWENINPATGPLYVEGAKAGDVLKVEILDIRFEETGVTASEPGMGVCGYNGREVTRIVSVKDGKIAFNDKVTIPVAGMLGVIGTAPANGEEIPTGTPGLHGGNMDCKKIGIGATLYLPVNVDGALLAIGDMHAAQGDGEVGVCGIETPGEVTVRVSVLHDFNLPLPLLYNGKELMTIYSAQTLDEAADGASKMMLDVLVGTLGIDEDEAGLLMSAVADLCICQVVDPLKTCRVELPRWVLDRYHNPCE